MGYGLTIVDLIGLNRTKSTPRIRQCSFLRKSFRFRRRDHRKKKSVRFVSSVHMLSSSRLVKLWRFESICCGEWEEKLSKKASAKTNGNKQARIRQISTTV
jgi:hypothetical protein